MDGCDSWHRYDGPKGLFLCCMALTCKLSGKYRLKKLKVHGLRELCEKGGQCEMGSIQAFNFCVKKNS